jgi:hypothetical protein
MKTEQIIKTLQEYNDWRRSRGKWDVDAFNTGESLFDTISAQKIGLTLDAAIEKLQTLERERDEARHIASYWRNMSPDLGKLKRNLKHKFSWEKGSK